jgi:TRAP-type C4-dicarboxylate transport system permease small subunit
MSQQSDNARAGLFGLARRIIELWALAGGFLLLGIVLINAYSLVGRIVFDSPVPGDFEMVEVGVAISAFSFLPYCQLTGANVTADIFTQGAGPRTVAFLTLLSGLIALAFSTLLIWRMGQGLLDYRQYRETTTITGFPLWIAFVPILMSLALLAIACFISVRDALIEMREAKWHSASNA